MKRWEGVAVHENGEKWQISCPVGTIGYTVWHLNKEGEWVWKSDGFGTIEKAKRFCVSNSYVFSSIHQGVSDEY